MEYDVPVVVQCLLKCCLLFHSGSQKILGGQPHAQRWDRWNWLQSEAQTSNVSAVESDTTERCMEIDRGALCKFGSGGFSKDLDDLDLSCTAPWGSIVEAG